MKYQYGHIQGYIVEVAQELKSVPAAILLNQLIFWANKGKRVDGWVYKTYAELEEELAITKKQLILAYGKLERAGYLKTSVMKVNGVPVKHFRLLPKVTFQSDERELSIESDERELSSIYTETTINNIHNNTNVLSELKIQHTKLFYELVKKLGFGEGVRFTETRRRKLQARLKVYSEEELCRAATAIGADEFMQGENEGNKRYGTIDYLLRNDEKIEQWINNPESHIPTVEEALNGI